MSEQRSKPAVSMAEIKPELERLRRRGFLRSALSLGALTMLTGCDLSTHSGVDGALETMLRFDDRVQAALFSRQRLAATYPASAITRPFRFNAYYAEWQARPVPDNWVLDVSGLVADRRPWTLQALMALPQQGQITRHIYRGLESDRSVERRAAAHVPASRRHRSVGPLRLFQMLRWLFDQHRHGERAAPADHSGARFRGEAAGAAMGRALRLRIPTKLGFKSAKNLEAIEVTNKYPGGYWENQGYDWFAGI
jgi:DMSO/TMAO reductase YedYZ molybdopterin-dependent catalytic subunit